MTEILYLFPSKISFSAPVPSGERYPEQYEALLLPAVNLFSPFPIVLSHRKSSPAPVSEVFQTVYPSVLRRQSLPFVFDGYSPAQFGPHRRICNTKSATKIPVRFLPVCRVSNSGISSTTIWARFSFVIIRHWFRISS